MSLQLMKERIKCTGISPREEMICDGQNLLKEELVHDSSYSPTVYFYDPVNQIDDRPAKLRIYGRKYSSLNGNYENFLTTYDNPIKIGEYIHDTKDDTYWLVYNSFNVNDIHYEGKLIQCNYLLKWQLSDGTIVERWANIVSASKYDTGETGNSTIILSSNNFTILIGFCNEGIELESKRVFIDKKQINPTKVFKITRCDDVLYDSGSMGAILSFIADKTELNLDKDNQELRICDYIDTSTSLPPSPSEGNETTDLCATISGNTNLKNGFSRTYTVMFTDKSGNEVDWDDEHFTWNVIADFDIGLIEQSISDDTIKLSVDDDSLIGESFLLSVMVDDNAITQLTIDIVEGF